MRECAGIGVVERVVAGLGGEVRSQMSERGGLSQTWKVLNRKQEALGRRQEAGSRRHEAGCMRQET